MPSYFQARQPISSRGVAPANAIPSGECTLPPRPTPNGAELSPQLRTFVPKRRPPLDSAIFRGDWSGWQADFFEFYLYLHYLEGDFTGAARALARLDALDGKTVSSIPNLLRLARGDLSREEFFRLPPQEASAKEPGAMTSWHPGNQPSQDGPEPGVRHWP